MLCFIAVESKFFLVIFFPVHIKFLTVRVKNNISAHRFLYRNSHAWVAELVDARDLKSLGP